ncbi:hypothetical protein [Pantoea brenneri]|nr:hypothetical protein [Pantoea brenneri]
MISDERLEYILTTGNTRGKDAQEMARELLALRKAFSEPAGAIPADDIQWLERGGKAEISIHWINSEGCLKLYRQPDLTN